MVSFAGHPVATVLLLIMAGNKIAKKTNGRGIFPPSSPHLPPYVSKFDPQNLISFKIMEQICFLDEKTEEMRDSLTSKGTSSS